MPCLTAERRAELELQLTRKETQLTNLYSSFDDFDGVREYKFNSGEDAQQTKYRSLSELQNIIDRLEANIARIRNLLGLMGLSNIVLRRKGY